MFKLEVLEEIIGFYPFMDKAKFEEKDYVKVHIYPGIYEVHEINNETDKILIVDPSGTIIAISREYFINNHCRLIEE